MTQRWVIKTTQHFLECMILQKYADLLLKRHVLLSVLKSVVLLNNFVQTVIHFSGYFNE